MRVLILGGTQFVGRAIAETALAAGDAVTLFHRGRSNPAVLPQAEHVHGDRDGGLAVLAGRTWDAVVDVSGYVPRLVRDSAETLAGRAGRYVFISSVSVYASPLRAGFVESAPLATLTDPGTEQVTGETYGGLKAACERVVRETWADQATILRPSLVGGPGDLTDRFGYWVRRIAGGGEVLAPAPATAPVQVLDVRDLAAFVRLQLAAGAPGPFHLAGPRAPLTFAGLLDACRAACGSDARITWADPDWLVAAGVQPWSQLPLWIPGPDVAHHQADVSAALAAGFAPRPIEATVADTLAYERACPPAARPARAGLALTPALTPEREAELLGAWGAVAGPGQPRGDSLR